MAKVEMSEALDQDAEISPTYILERNWNCLLFPDVISKADSIVFYRAVCGYDAKVLIAIHFEYGGQPISTPMQREEDFLLKATYTYANEYMIVANDNGDFLFYKDQNNEYYLMAGKKSLLSSIFAGTDEQLRIEYFKSLVAAGCNEDEIAYHARVWEKYSGLLPNSMVSD